jgi:predicted Rossmann fold nucleotide-binding protein DprA/Smf involved in DNA uptake
VPDEEQERPTPGKPDKAARPAREPRPTPAARQDQARSDWIRQHLLARLDSRREQGLKETVLIAATCHISPYTDLQQAEVLAELRELKRQGAVRQSAGRWVRVRRLGW